MATALDILLQDWRERLRGWSADGSLASAARHALELGADDPPLLTQLTSQWTDGDFSALPPIVLLPASSMPGAAGAYAISTGTIYLNEDWLETASDERAIAVLTEELGHHLDVVLNEIDTIGDEGYLFSKYIDVGPESRHMQQETSSPASDKGIVFLEGNSLLAEMSEYRISDSFDFPLNGVDILNQQRLLGSANSSARGADGELLITGSNGGKIYIAELDANGVVHVRNWPFPAAEHSEAFSIASLNNNVALSGYIDYGWTQNWARLPVGNFVAIVNEEVGEERIHIYETGVLSDYDYEVEDVTLNEKILVVGGQREELDYTLYDNGSWVSKGYIDVFDITLDHRWSKTFEDISYNGELERGRINSVEISGLGAEYSIYATGWIMTANEAGLPNQVGLLEKVDKNGNTVWKQVFGSLFEPVLEFNDVEVDSQGSIYVVGTSINSDWGEYGLDIFAQKYSRDGDLVWHTTLEEPGNQQPTSLGLDSLGNIIISGKSQSSLGSRHEIAIATLGQNGSVSDYSEFSWGWYRVDDLSLVSLGDDRLYLSGNDDEGGFVLSYDMDDSALNSDTATFSIVGSQAVGELITVKKFSNDADGDGQLSHTWEASADGTIWSSIATGPSLTIAQDQEGQQIRVITGYTDGEGFSESVTTGPVSIPYVNDGQATFSITGTNAVGQTLSATASTDDPDGNGTFSHTWQTSANGTSWSSIGTGPSLMISNALEGQKIRLQTSYTDGQGFEELITSEEVLIPDQPPAPPSAPDLLASSDTGISDTDNITSSTTPTLTGTAEPGATINLLLDGVLYPANTAVTTADPVTGNWSYTHPPEHAATEDVRYSLSVTATDQAGNTSDPSDAIQVTIDLTAPLFSSGSVATPIDENSGSGQVVYTAKVSDLTDVTFGLKAGTADSSAFSINAASGAVTLTADPDYETQSTYAFTVVATDGAGNSSEQDVTLAVTDLNDTTSFEKQRIGTNQSVIDYRPGASVSIPLHYSTSDNDSGLSGLTLNIHHDTERLTPIATNNGISDQLQADSVTATAITADTSDLDNSVITDQIIQVSWGSVNNSFPGSELPAQVAIANFETNSDAYDPVTGEPISTTVNFTASETASNYGFEGTPVTLTPESFHLDIDGDGRTTALGDGLMVIRKLFGTAFAGDALTNKAASANAAVDTEAMHHWLEAGIASGDLDVDRDGKTTALGDGLMVIRQMFGSAFAGDALIEKAISNSSPYSGLTNAAELVSQNIQSLIPTLPAP